ncbi:hypothetical protein ACFL18_02195 [Patescibacteria group bacterium]
MKFKNLFKRTTKAKNFFDYPAREQKKIVNKAVNGSNEKQAKLIQQLKDDVAFSHTR